MGPLERTFQVVKGVGPWRERDLWARGVDGWPAYRAQLASGPVLGGKLDALVSERIGLAEQAFRDRNWAALAGLVPSREHWRIAAQLTDELAYLDLEADDAGEPTIIGVKDRQGVASFRRDTGFEGAEERLASSWGWVTFNGGAYDVPVLRRKFPQLPRPAIHVDLRFLARRARLPGGLKDVERTIGIGRPRHLEGLKGLDAIRLWREWTINRELAALRILVEYNLYDAINLHTLLEVCVQRIGDELGWAQEPAGRRFERGDVLYDVSRMILALPG